MTSRWLAFILRLCGGVVFAAAIAWPTVALSIRCLASATPSISNATPSVRQWALLGRSVWLASAATALTVLIALPVAAAIVGARGKRRRSFAVGSLFVVLLTPPMVHSFGWDHLLPSAISPTLRCVVVWSFWAFPIPALILAAGWRRGGRRAYESALLSVGPAKALIVGTRPVLQRYALLSASILFLLFLGDYGVPHASGLTVLATELLGWASNSPEPIDTLVPSIPGVVLTILGLAVAWWWARGLDLVEAEDLSLTRAEVDWAAVVTAGIFGVGWLLPLLGLVARLGSIRSLFDAAITYKSDITWSFLTAGAAGTASALLAAALMGRPALSRSVCWGMLLLGALPGALIGLALLAAYNRAGASAIVDHWPILSLCYLARFGWIAVLAGRIASERRSDIEHQAAVDGADARAVATELHWPLHAPVLGAAAAVITALSLAEVPASSLVRVPTFNPIAHVVIEKFHRFEYAMLASLCVLLIAAACAGAVLLVTTTQNKVR